VGGGRNGMDGVGFKLGQFQYENGGILSPIAPMEMINPVNFKWFAKDFM